jgi:hypothetical protein
LKFVTGMLLPGARVLVGRGQVPTSQTLFTSMEDASITMGAIKKNAKSMMGRCGPESIENLLCTDCK